MDVFEAIAARHSYRGPFADRPVPRADLLRIVEAGIRAPSGRNMQTTTFVIVDEPDLVRTIAAMHASNRAVQTARAFIACIVDRQPAAVYEGHSFQVEDCAAAVENMLLAITALGYASVWIDGWLRLEDRAAAVGRLLGLPDGKVVRVLLPLGVPAERWSQKEKKPLAERAWFNRYGAAVPAASDSAPTYVPSDAAALAGKVRGAEGTPRLRRDAPDPDREPPEPRP